MESIPVFTFFLNITRLIPNRTWLISENTWLILNRTRLILENTRLFLNRTRLISENTRLFLNRTRLILENTRLIPNRTRLISENTRLILNRTRLISENTRLFLNRTWLNSLKISYFNITSRVLPRTYPFFTFYFLLFTLTAVAIFTAIHSAFPAPALLKQHHLPCGLAGAPF